jgi:hypothetical protein
MQKLVDYKQLEDTFAVIDLLASEYGWTIETIQNLTLPEISGLIRCIMIRKGVKAEELPPPTNKQTTVTDLVKLAKKFGATKEQLDKLKNGQKVNL